MKTNIKPQFMDPKEFRELGYLQELNRLFLHPLGLALTIGISDVNGEEFIAGIIDKRDEPGGIIYDLKNSDKDRIKKFQDNSKYIAEQQNIEIRYEKYNFLIEPIEINKTESKKK